MTTRELAPFIELECAVGGVHCPAWEEWFAACEDTDPNAIEEDRDPLPLLEWPFNPLACERPDICRLYRARALKDSVE
jgi:hypothetical protein